MYRKTAGLVGLLFIIGTVSGVLSGVITGPVQSAPDGLTSLAAHETQWILGTLLILVMGFALSMVPVLLYPLFKKYNEVLAMGAVVFRGVLEAVCYIAVVASMLLLLSASRLDAGDAAAMQTAAELLIHAQEWFSQITALVFSIGALIIYFLFYQTRLIPRWLSGWGFMGAVLYFAAPLVSMLGPGHLALSFDSALGFLLAPLALQEMVFAVWLIAKGFNPSPTLARSTTQTSAFSASGVQR
jgi:hypothetical protein